VTKKQRRKWRCFSCSRAWGG